MVGYGVLPVWALDRRYMKVDNKLGTSARPILFSASNTENSRIHTLPFLITNSPLFCYSYNLAQ